MHFHFFIRRMCQINYTSDSEIIKKLCCYLHQVIKCIVASKSNKYFIKLISEYITLMSFFPFLVEYYIFSTSWADSQLHKYILLFILHFENGDWFCCASLFKSTSNFLCNFCVTLKINNGFSHLFNHPSMHFNLQKIYSF